MDGLERECERKGYSCILQHVDEQEDELDAALYAAKEKKPMGLIFLGGNFRHPREKVAQLELPACLVPSVPREWRSRALVACP